MTPEPESLSEQEATRLWKRAAELQADAARRAEARAAGGAQGLDGGAPPSRGGDGYALVHVRAAALEAGIGEEFVETALAELRAGRVAAQASAARGGAISRWILGNPDEAVVASRDVLAAPAAVLTAMEAIFPHEPYRLTLRDRTGDPADGGVLLFDIQGASYTGAAEKGFTGEASFADLRQVVVTLSRRTGDPAVTTVTLTAPVAWARRINAVLVGGLALVGGGLGSAASAGLAGALGFLGPVGFGIVAVAGGVAAASGSLKVFQGLHRYGLGRGRRALEGLLAEVAARAEGGWGIAPR
jgi:hypothetical protein